MARKSAARRPNRDVFINCPFDEQFEPLFHVIVFTIAACGYRPRCALEENDSGIIRFDKLTNIIEACGYGVHDLSRIEISEPTGTPRFNMPLELGLYLGASRFGTPTQRTKKTLILARRREHWAPALSDLAGNDPEYHGDRPISVARHVRDFLHQSPRGRILPGEKEILATKQRFDRGLAEAAERVKQTLEEAKRFRNYMHFLYEFLRVQALI